MEEELVQLQYLSLFFINFKFFFIFNKVHHSRKFFAVAEKGISPNIYIFEYPSLNLYRILRKGTEKSYSNITFSMNGLYLASVNPFKLVINIYYFALGWFWTRFFIVYLGLASREHNS